MPSTRTRLLDGAMGTSLLGQVIGLPERWLLERPSAVESIHRAHVNAGAEAVLTCTFNLAAPRLGALAGDLPAIAAAAVRVARAAGAEEVWGAVGPTGLVRPGAPGPSRAALGAMYARAFEALARAGADHLLAESQWDLEEARAALDAGRATGLPTAVSFTYGEGLSLPGGPPVAAALRAVAAEGAAAAGVNCVPPDAALARLARELAPSLAAPLLLKPSPGLPGAVLPPEDFAGRVAGLPAAWLGACCGGSAEHVAALAAALRAPPR